MLVASTYHTVNTVTMFIPEHVELELPVYQVKLDWLPLPCIALYQVRLDWLPLPCIACLSG